MACGEPPSKKPRISELADYVSDSLPGCGTNWVCTYNKRCPLVLYLKSDAGEDDMVKFFYKDLETMNITNEEFTFKDFECRYNQSFDKLPDLGQLVEAINKPIVEAGITKFSLKDIKEKPFWAEVLKLVGETGIKIPERSYRAGVKGMKWKSQDDLEELMKKFPDEMEMVFIFLNALAMDFTNGRAKKFLFAFIDKMIKTIPTKILEVDRPELNDSVTTKVETCSNKVQFYVTFPPDSTPPQSRSASTTQPQSRSASTSASTSSMIHPIAISPSSWSDHGQRKVSDCEVFVKEWPGRYPLVTEAKKATDSRDKADEQILQQMFSKFFFQDIIFGITISPLNFCIQVLVKDPSTDLDSGNSNRNINLSKSKNIAFFDVDGSFQTESLKQLFSFVYSLLDWSGKTKCVLYKPKA